MSDHGAANHGHGQHGVGHVHATIDHLASEQTSSLAMLVRMDGALMSALGCGEGALGGVFSPKKVSSLELVLRFSKKHSQELRNNLPRGGGGAESTEWPPTTNV